MIEPANQILESALSAARRGDLDSAREHYRLLLEAQPDRADGLLGLGSLELAAGRPGDAELLWITTTPIAVDRTRVNLGVSSPPDIDGGRISEEFREKTREFVFSFLAEDKEIIESVQKNLPVFEATQPYCDMERTNWEFGQYLVRRLLAEAAR